MAFKTKSELMNNEKKAEEIIFGKTEKEKTAKPTTVILDDEIKREFQALIKEKGLNMGIIFNAFMKSYIKNPEIRKAVISEISED